MKSESIEPADQNEFTNKKITAANKYEKCGYYRLHIAEYSIDISRS